jgi:hypothetical protein
MWPALEAASVADIDPETVEEFIRTATVIQRSVARRAHARGVLDPSGPEEP